MHGNSMNDALLFWGSLFSGSLYDAIAKIKDGGLLTAPSDQGWQMIYHFQKSIGELA